MKTQNPKDVSFFPSRISNFQKKILRIPPAVVFLLCLILTGFSVYFAYLKNQTETLAELDKTSRQMNQSVRQRMNVYADTLLHTRSFVMASPLFSRGLFQTFVSELNLKSHYPGFQGIGYTIRILPDELEQHTQIVRSEGFPNYRVWPETPRDEYFSIVYLEPFDERNQRAFGFDMSTEANRKAAMDHARDTGSPALTAKVTLVQETEKDVQKGFLLYVPVYKPGMPTETVEQRRMALQGFVYSPFRTRDLFNEILQEEFLADNPVVLAVYDGNEIKSENLLYSSVGSEIDLTGSLQSFRTTQIDVYGKVWTLIVRPTYLYMNPWGSIPWGFLAFGLFVSSVIYWFFKQTVNASNTLARSENQIRLIADALPVLIAYVDINSRYIFYNHTFLEWFQTPPQNFQWRNEESKTKVFSGQKVIEDLTMDHPGLGQRKVTEELIPHVRNGEVIGFVVLATDMTEQVKIRDQIREEQRITEIISNVGMKVTSELSLEKVVQSLTDSATEVTGAQFGAFFYTVQNSQGESYTLYSISGVEKEAFANFPMPRNTKLLSETFSGRRIVRYDDVTQAKDYGENPPFHGMPEGHLKVRSYLAAPVRSKSGEVFGSLICGHPEPGVFTERSEELLEGIAAQAAVALDNAKLFEQAQKANRMKDEFLATLSHELRTPLNVILGHAQILKEEAPSLGEYDASLDAIYRNAQVQTQIISDLLDISAIITGKMAFQPQKVNMLELVKAAIESVRMAIESKQIDLYFRPETPDLEIVGDPTRLQQVIWNLLSNAVKFTQRGGRVEIHLKQEGSRCLLSVLDNGAGIDPGFLPHIFDRFRQEDSGFARNYGGLGLGLSITRQLVEMHGGTIEVQSQGKGKGTAFYVNLPIASIQPEEVEKATAPKPTESSPNFLQAQKGILDGVRVLVLDDEKDARDLVAQILKKTGAKVGQAATAEEALKSLEKEKFDVIISDLGMPEQDGLQFIRKLREKENQTGHFTPAVVLTAYAGEEDKQKAISAGYQMHLSKPLKSQTLIHSIQKLVEF